ncbi:MAG TPA: hypothetical protein V6D29_09455 [Leptolyngbyaceae cyanobacterium]
MSTLDLQQLLLILESIANAAGVDPGLAKLICLEHPPGPDEFNYTLQGFSRKWREIAKRAAAIAICLESTNERHLQFERTFYEDGVLCFKDYESLTSFYPYPTKSGTIVPPETPLAIAQFEPDETGLIQLAIVYSPAMTLNFEGWLWADCKRGYIQGDEVRDFGGNVAVAEPVAIADAAAPPVVTEC